MQTSIKPIWMYLSSCEGHSFFFFPKKPKMQTIVYGVIVESSYFLHAQKLLSVQYMNYAYTKH